MKLKLGFSTCPNDTFIFDALVNKHINTENVVFEPVLKDVEELNKLALNAELDITKLSIAAYPNVSENYIILDSGSALGNNNGPILISKHKIYPDEINDLSIAIPGIHTTANLLLSIAFPKAANKKVYLFSDIEQVILDGETDAGLIIHESRFTYQQKGLKKIIDLGEYWEKNFKQLIPLGCIAMKRSLPSETIKKVNNLIKSSVNHAFKHPNDSENFIKKYAQEMSVDVMKKHIELYVNQYSVDLGTSGKKAIEFIFDKGKKSGLLPEIKHPVFIAFTKSLAWLLERND